MSDSGRTPRAPMERPFIIRSFQEYTPWWRATNGGRSRFCTSQSKASRRSGWLVTNSHTEPPLRLAFDDDHRQGSDGLEDYGWRPLIYATFIPVTYSANG